MAIVVLGDVAVDIVSYLRTPLLRGSDAPAQIRVMPGGSGANVAAWLGRVGSPVTFVGRVGDDAFGRWLAEDLASEGVSLALQVDRERPTAVIQVLVEPGGERTMVPDRGANAHWQEGDVSEELIASADLLHLVGYVLFDPGSRYGALRAMEYARAHGVPVSLDTSSHGPLTGLGGEAFWSLAGHVSIFLPNRNEARVLTGLDDPEAALAALRPHADLVAIKLDRDGCLAGQPGVASPCRQSAPVIPVPNATGAGDAFDAGFLAAWVRERDLAAACKAGVELGSRAASLPTTR
ncbi:MAG: carbohydrate kinase family protein [Bacteroidota bacterium]